MAKRKTVESEIPKAEPVKKRASSPKPSAATHKRVTKKQSESEAPEAQVVAQAVATISQQEICSVAYSYWQARGYSAGDPVQDWLRAEKELFELAQNR